MTQVFGNRMLSELETSLTNMASKVFSKTPLILSGDEFVAAFVNPDHVAPLRQVEELVGRIGTGATTHTTLASANGENANIQVNFGGIAPIIMPQYVRHGLQPTCPGNVLAKITEWVEERFRLGAVFGDAIDALYYLNGTCGDLRAMSVMFPAMPTIMGAVSNDGDHRTVKRARKLTDSTGFGKLPKLPVTVKQRLIEVSAVVNATTLLNDAPDPTVNKHEAVFTLLTAASSRNNLFYDTTAARFI